MARQHLRVFVACGTGLRFGRLLEAVTPLARDERVALFVQRGAPATDFAHLPGAAVVSREEFAARLVWADAIVCHAGAGTLYETLRAGHHPIAMARLVRFQEMVNDHQEELLRALARRGRVDEIAPPVTYEQVAAVARLRGAPDATACSATLVAAVAKSVFAPASRKPKSPLSSVASAARLVRELAVRTMARTTK